jgi:hypothetical protein
MDNSEKEREFIARHIKEASKLLIDLDTMPCNINLEQHKWEDVIKARKEHVTAFIASLRIQEKHYEHFK